MTSPSSIQIQWRGVTLGGLLSDYGISKLSGWLGLPGAEFAPQPNQEGHGLLPTPGTHRERQVIAGGFLRSKGGNRDALISYLMNNMLPVPATSKKTEPLIVTVGGVTRNADAQLVSFIPSTDIETWASGTVPWTAEWRCPNPRIYDEWLLPPTTALVANTPGLTLPITLPATLPVQPIGGTVNVFNSGNDEEGSPTQITLTGEQYGTVGVENTITGARVIYPFSLLATDVLLIDTEKGGAWLNGEFRAPTALSSVTRRLRAKPGANAYHALGTAGTGSPSMTVTVRPANW